MGLIYANTLPLLEEHARNPLGNVLFLGYPDIYFSVDAFRQWAAVAGVAVGAVGDSTDPKRPSYPSAKAILDSIGVRFDCLDASPFEGATVLLDLNSPTTPADLCERWDAIVDHGTMEHVFHLPNLLSNVFRMLKPGGRVIHSAPGNNYFDHGFYQFSPTFFPDYYGTNEWKVERHTIVQLTPAQETEPPFFTPYIPEYFERLSYGGLDDKLYMNLFVATKTGQSTHDRIPTQGYYRRRW